MLKSKKKKDDQSPSKKALSSDYDGDQAINSSEAETSPGSEDKASISTSGSKSALKSSKKAAKKSSKAKKSDEVSIKMPATIPTPKTRKPPSRFSLRGWLLNNPLFPPPFGHSSSSSSPKLKNKTKDGSSFTSGGHGAGHFSGSTNAGGTGASNSAQDQDQFDNRSLWRDNVSSSSSNVQVRGGSQSQAGLAGSIAGGKSAGGQSTSAVRECPLCMAECTLDQFPILRNCPHLFCMDCLHTYTKLEIHEGRVNLKCPQCNELIHPNDIALLLGEKAGHLLTLYESLMLRRILATDPDTRWCPRPNCTFAVIATGCASCPKIECEHPGCGYAFCYHCKAEWHPNQTCDAARAQRNLNLRSSSATVSLEGGVITGFREHPSSASGAGLSSTGAQSSSYSEVKACPRCQVLAVKMHDGSCNHMTCAVCGVEFCWLCMKEISDLHYLSPSGCTFWGKKPWSRKKKLLWQLGTLIGAPVGIALLAGISIPAMLIGIPSWVGRKIHDHFKGGNKTKRNIAVVGGVVCSIIMSPFLAGLAVSIGVPILLCYVYGVVPIALCRSEGCGVTTSSSGVKIDIDEDPPYRPTSNLTDASRPWWPTGNNNPSIGEVSLGASLSMGSGCILENAGDTASREPDRESASNTGVAGASITGSVASSSYVAMKAIGGRHNRLEVGVDVHPRKKFSFSSERLSETVSQFSERSTTVSLADETGGGNSVAASTRALAGSLLAYRFGDSQSMHNYRSGADNHSMVNQFEDEVSLRSLPMPAQHGSCMPSGPQGGNGNGVGGPSGTGSAAHSLGGQQADQRSLHSTHVHMSNLNPPRSMSPVSNFSGDELSHGGRRSQRRRPLLDKQLSENSSLLSAEDTVSERVRFDDNISFIDDTATASASLSTEPNVDSAVDNTSLSGRLINKNPKIETSILTEETAEELAEVISPELKPKLSTGQPCNPILKSSSMTIDEAGSSILSQGVSGVTLLSIGEQINDSTPSQHSDTAETPIKKENKTSDGNEEATLKESFSAKL